MADIRERIGPAVGRPEVPRLHLGELLSRYGAPLILVLMAVVLALTTPRFLSTSNLFNIANAVTTNAILAIGVTFVIISGAIDLSMGSVLALSSCALALALVQGWPVPLAILAGLGTGTLCGLVNGLMVTALRLPSFIATLAMLSSARGLALVITDGHSIFGFPQEFLAIGLGRLWGIPLPGIIVAVLALAAHLVLTYTRLGRYAYAIGGNEEASTLAGINVAGYRVLLFAISGLLSGTAGFMFAARLTAAQPTAGIGYELDAIAAAVIGGTSLSGGTGSIGGTIVGALVIGLLRNGLNLNNVSPFWQSVIIGMVIAIAVYLDQLRHRLKR